MQVKEIQEVDIFEAFHYGVSSNHIVVFGPKTPRIVIKGTLKSKTIFIILVKYYFTIPKHTTLDARRPLVSEKTRRNKMWVATPP